MKNHFCLCLFTPLIWTVLSLENPNRPVRLSPGESNIEKHILDRSVLTYLRSGISFPENEDNSADDLCTTPKNEKGHCKSLSDCPAVLSNIYKEYPKICKWNGLNPVVCCPDVVPFESTTEPITSDKVPDLTVPGCGMRTEIQLSREKRALLKDMAFSEEDSENRPEVVVRDMAFSEEDSENRPEVVGGVHSVPYSWPWMVGISQKFGLSERFLCGGAIISSKYVISAAHCFKISNKPVSPSVYTFRVGGHTLNDGTKYDVEDVIVHESYKPSQNYHDIAVLKVKGSISLNDKVIPVCLPKPLFVSQDFKGREATVTGWGDTFFGGARSTVLQEVSIPVVTNKECNSAYSSVASNKYPQGITRGQICAGLSKGGKDACQGDSGGPLVLKESKRWTLVGIVSFGLNCAEPGYPGVYTRVSHYIKWIAANTDLGKQ
ncbi:clotting factor B-like isoform X2 [Tachypleus tridentatus]